MQINTFPLPSSHIQGAAFPHYVGLLGSPLVVHHAKCHYIVLGAEKKPANCPLGHLTITARVKERGHEKGHEIRQHPNVASEDGRASLKQTRIRQFWQCTEYSGISSTFQLILSDTHLLHRAAANIRGLSGTYPPRPKRQHEIPS